MVIGKWKRVLLAACLVLSGCLTHPEPSQENRLLGIKNYACYYGTGRVKDLAKFDLVIIQDNYSSEEIAFLKQNETFVLGYISLGQDYPLKRGDGRGPGGYASWYLDHFIGDGTKNPGKDNQPDKCEDWISYFVNTGDPNWHRFVVKRMEGLISKGFDGAFLDVVGYPYEYPDELKENVLKPGLLRIIKRLRKTYPKSYLVVNGYIFLEEIHNLIDGVMCESFSSTFKKHSEDVLEVTIKDASRINRIRGYPKNPSLVVLTLDYVKRGDFDLIAFDYERARSFGFIQNVSYGSSEVPDLCMVNPVNRFKAIREADGILLTWEAKGEYLEESMVSHYVIKRGTKPILNETDLKEASLVSDKVPRDATSYKDLSVPKGTFYYTLQAFNEGGMELVGCLRTKVNGG